MANIFLVKKIVNLKFFFFLSIKWRSAGDFVLVIHFLEAEKIYRAF